MPIPARTCRCPRPPRRLLALLACAAGAAWCDPALGQTGAGLLLTPFPKEQAISASAEAMFLDRGHTQGSDLDFRLSIYDSEGRVRLQPGNLVSPRVGWDLALFDIRTDFPGLPNTLTDVSIGVATPVAKIGEWVVGLSAGVGYAGPEPFSDSNAYYGKGTLAVFRQLGESEFLVFVLDYDRNRLFLPDVPLPGFAYTRRIDPTLLLAAGVPLTSITWEPNERFKLRLEYLLIDNLQLAVGYEFVENLTLFGNIEYRAEGFFVPGLANEDDRLIFQQRRAEIGLRWDPRESASLHLAAGYAWGQEFSVGFDSRETDQLTDVSDEPYVRAALEVRF